MPDLASQVNGHAWFVWEDAKAQATHVVVARYPAHDNSKASYRRLCLVFLMQLSYSRSLHVLDRACLPSFLAGVWFVSEGRGPVSNCNSAYLQ
jgi:hypothetical protein